MKAYRFKIPLTRPLVLQGEVHRSRTGILIERDGQWAEASPLPGFSAESMADVITALRGESSELPASLDFALSALESKFDKPLKVAINQLWMGGLDDILKQAEVIAATGCRAVKLKVGRNDVGSDIQLIKRIRERLPSSIQLRLDANRAWEFDEAVSFLRGVEDVNWEYIEEPLRHCEQLEDLYSQTGARYALDETLLTEKSLAGWPNAVALICKPTILGGRAAVERLAATGKPVVFSASFESGVGIARIMQLASEFSDGIPAGLGTLEWLATDQLLQSPSTDNGFMTLESLAVDTTGLEPIEL